MDEMGVMLSMLNSVKVLVSKDDLLDYRNAGVNQIMVTAIQCIVAYGRLLLPLIMWLALPHQGDWTTYPIPRWHYEYFES